MKKIEDKGPHSQNEDIYVVFEMEFKGEKIVPKTELKFRNERGTFRFICLAHNIRLDKSWIDVIGENGWRSFRPDQLMGLAQKRRKAVRN